MAGRPMNNIIRRRPTGRRLISGASRQTIPSSVVRLVKVLEARLEKEKDPERRTTVRSNKQQVNFFPWSAQRDSHLKPLAFVSSQPRLEREPNKRCPQESIAITGANNRAVGARLLLCFYPPPARSLASQWPIVARARRRPRAKRARSARSRLRLQRSSWELIRDRRAATV